MRKTLSKALNAFGARERIRKIETLPADGSDVGVALAPRWPIVPVLPTPVVDGQRWCVGASYDVAVEYLGVGGVWVAQASKTYGVWVWVDNAWLLSDILSDSYLIVNGETLSVNGEILISPKSIFEV